MFIEQAHIAIALIVVLFLLLMAYLVGALRTNNAMLNALEQASRTGTNFKLGGRAHKVIQTSVYIDLVKRAENIQPIWDWSTANGKMG